MTSRNQLTGGGPGRGTPQTQAAARRRARAAQPTRPASGSIPASRGTTSRPTPPGDEARETDGGRRGAERARQPGRDKPRHRAPGRGSARVEAGVATTGPGRLVQSVTQARRAVVMIVVLAVLLLSCANSLRIYFSQQQQKAVALQQIAERQAAIDKLTDEIKRWQDPSYVKAQARDRLGWVVPGETGYRVVEPDGTLLGGGAGIQSESTTSDDDDNQQWWSLLAGSLRTADQPTPAEPTPTPEPTIIKLVPSASASPSR